MRIPQSSSVTLQCSKHYGLVLSELLCGILQRVPVLPDGGEDQLPVALVRERGHLEGQDHARIEGLQQEALEVPGEVLAVGIEHVVVHPAFLHGAVDPLQELVDRGPDLQLLARELRAEPDVPAAAHGAEGLHDAGGDLGVTHDHLQHVGLLLQQQKHRTALNLKDCKGVIGYPTLWLVLPVRLPDLGKCGDGPLQVFPQETVRGLFELLQRSPHSQHSLGTLVKGIVSLSGRRLSIRVDHFCFRTTYLRRPPCLIGMRSRVS
mmetsp:Transcript_24829/g.51617  ORF Transcript_24829/g.51617 Transcript_24829/m.51617 type:complete len:263 (-) Transcript_24829:68-856(-)